MAAMIKVLFICLGNICRSPMAETIFRHLVEECGLEDKFEVDSAGLIDYHEGEQADNRMRRHASVHGYYITHRSRPIETDDFSRFDYIVGMDRHNIRALQSMQPPGTKAQILPIGTFLTHNSPPARGGVAHRAEGVGAPARGVLEVPDPYYGGDQGFENVITMLEEACATLLDSLSDSHNQ